MVQSPTTLVILYSAALGVPISPTNLPEEIILEILTLLPMESVLDCKLVCKLWRDLVSHPSFSQIHLKHLSDDESHNKVSFIFSSYNSANRQREYYYAEFDENCDKIFLSRKTRMNLSPEFQNYFFLGSCNGLICFHSPYNQCGYGTAYICNPITREYIRLPDLEGKYLWNGFGYCPYTNDYKVVRTCFRRADPDFGIAQVYTVGSGNGWRNLGEIDMKRISRCDGVFANGALHWVNKDILAFDLTNEKFSELPSPPCLTQAGVPDFSICLGVLGDFLCATYYYDNCSEIWVLEKNKDNSDLSWSKQFHVNSYIHLLLFEFSKSGRLLYHRGGGIYSYDPKASPAKIDVGFGISVSEPISHKNTLVSLKALGEKGTKIMKFRERA